MRILGTKTVGPTRPAGLLVAAAAAWLAAGAGPAWATVVEIDQMPGRGQLLRQMGGLADIQPGVTALEDGDFAQAAKLAHGYIERTPADTRAHLLLLLAWYAQRDDGRIDSHLDEVGAQQPALGASLRETVAGIYVSDGRLYRAGVQLAAIPAPRRTDQSEFVAAAVAARQGNVKEARSRIDRLSTKLPESVPLAINQSRLALMATDYEAAAVAAGRAVKLSPNLENALLLLGTARMQQDRTADAFQAFQAILARNPTHGTSALSVGLLHLAAGRNGEAAKAFRSARSLGAGDARPHVGEAAAALAAGDLAGARSASEAARKQSPEDPMAAVIEILVRGPAAMGATAGAREHAGQFFPDLLRTPVPPTIAAELSDRAATRRLAVANVLAHTWSGNAALGWLGKAKPEVEGPMLSLTRARAQASAGKWADSERTLKALQQSAAGAGLIGSAAQAAGVASAQNRGEEAVDQLRAAIRRAPELPSLRVSLGDLLNKLEQPDKAAAEYRAALKLAPKDPRTLNQLAATLALIGGQTDLQEGLRLADAGLQLKPHYLMRAQLLDTRADLLYRLGREQAALAAYRELSGTVGGMQGPIPWHRYGELALAAGDKKAAEAAFEKALDYGRSYPERAQALTHVAALSRPSGT